MSAVVDQLPNRVSVRLGRSAPARMIGSLLLADGLALCLSVGIAVSVKALMRGGLDIDSYFALLPFLGFFWMAFAAAGLYSGLALTPPEEIRRCTTCSAVVFVFLSITTLSLRGASSYLKPTLFAAIALSAMLIPALRAMVREWLGRRSWWGYPAVIFGAPARAASIAELMLRNPWLGLKPLAIVHDDRGASIPETTIPVLSSDEILELDVRAGTYAVVTPDVHRGASPGLIRFAAQFSHILAIPELSSETSNLLVTTKAVGNLLGLEMRQRLLLPQNRMAKRGLDLIFTLAALPVVLPLSAIIVGLVWIDSRGPAFYFQRRIGRGGKEFYPWKFRTMVVNAEEVLEDYLANDPALRLEWNRDHKLKNDPRVTRIGAFLRRSSLDELPQLWNVLKGEMSLVGPRPIVRAEIARYGGSFHSYTRVPGGITGLWQVSGRNDTTYAERVSLDEYYVRNWSVWLDLHILWRTLAAVVLRSGAY